jgi:hypothetical protein
MIGDGGKDRFDYLSRSMALTKLKSIQKALSSRNGGNAETQAHTVHVLFVIEQALKPRP